MDAIVYDTRLTPQVTGTIPIERSRFERVVGDNAVAVWDVLCACRDQNGHTTITYKGLQKKCTLNAKQIERALIRLRRSGLVVDLVKRRQRLKRPVEGGMAYVWAFPRRIFGARAVCHIGQVVVVPPSVWRWIREAKSRGGARSGSGRPQRRYDLESENSPEKVRMTQSATPRFFQSGVYDRKSKWGPYIYTTQYANSDLSGDVANFAAQSLPHDAAAPRQDLTLEHAPEKVGSVDTPAGDLGTKLGGGGKPPPPAGTYGIPPYPGPEVCPPALVPPPPKLPEDLSDLDAARWMVRAYRGAMESRYRKRCWVLGRRGSLEKSKHLQQLIDASALFRELAIAPAGWAAFSIDVWRDRVGKGNPPINWVYQLSRIEEHAGWYRREAPHSSRRAVYSKAAQVMFERYRRMRLELTQVGAQTRRDILPVVARWFPDDLYDRLAAAARRRAAEDQQLILQRAQRGDWLW